jgi:hypothetical protein
MLATEAGRCISCLKRPARVGRKTCEYCADVERTRYARRKQMAAQPVVKDVWGGGFYI